MSYNNLTNYYKTNVYLTKHHNFTYNDIYNFYPFERDINVDILINSMKEHESEEQINITDDEIKSYGINLQKVVKVTD